MCNTNVTYYKQIIISSFSQCASHLPKENISAASPSVPLCVSKGVEGMVDGKLDGINDDEGLFVLVDGF